MSKNMLYIILIPLLLIITPVFFVCWQALILFLSAKILGVAENSYLRSVKIVFWLILMFIPAILIYSILRWIGFPMVEIFGGSMFILLYFVIVHIFCQKYYGTGLSTNLGIFVLNLIANLVLSFILALIIALSLGFWAYKNSSVSNDGSKSVFHLDKSFEDSARATLNFGSGKIKW
jgi:hypothetical protein